MAVTFWHCLKIIGLTVSLALPIWANSITELNLTGGIGPASADYICRGIMKNQNNNLILITIDTPGGLDKSTRIIGQCLLNSSIPVVTYVAPSGARAASAGTYIVYASTLAAMAPGTHLGAASPVELSAGMGSEKTSNSTMNKKMTNDSLAYIRSLAELRQRNPEFAQKSVQNAATMTATDALKAKVIDFIATDQADLLGQLNGKSVVQAGKTFTIKTQGLTINHVPPDWRTDFLSIITDPTIAYLLLLLGFYGIFFELMHPGFMLPGVSGGIALLVALYALQLLPISYAGLALILLGLAFIISEAFMPSFGALGIGGTIAFILGSILLIDSDSQTYRIAWSAIFSMAAINLLIVFAVLTMLVKTRGRAVKHGISLLIGVEGKALGPIHQSGQALIQGEIWSAHAKNPIATGEPLKVIAARGLELEVEAISKKTV